MFTRHHSHQNRATLILTNYLLLECLNPALFITMNITANPAEAHTLQSVAPIQDFNFDLPD